MIKSAKKDSKKADGLTSSFKWQINIFQEEVGSFSNGIFDSHLIGTVFHS